MEKKYVSVLDRIACHNFVEADGYAYFSSWYYNGFFKVETGTGRTFFLGCFMDEKMSQRNIHKEIFLRNNRIFFCPWKGRHVHIWDLSDETICSAEIRRKEEIPFFIDEVIVGERDVFFLPDRKGVSVRRMDLESFGVTQINDKSEILGIPMADSKELFPVPELVEEYHIEYADKFSWRQVFHKNWYAFQPAGRHMLHYTEGTDRLETVPLAVANEEELEDYLHKVKTELFNENPAWENMVIKLQDLFKKIKMEESDKMDAARAAGNIGKKIWKECSIS